MRQFKTTLALVFTILLSALSGAKVMLDWIGRVDAFQDAGDPHGLTAKALEWLFSTPWWVPGLIVAVMGAGILYLLAPARQHPENAIKGAIPSSPTGMGGHARVSGNRSKAEGGAAGVSGLYQGGSGGHAHVEGDDSVARGGDGATLLRRMVAADEGRSVTASA